MVCINITQPHTIPYINSEYQHHQFHAMQSPSLSDNAVDYCVLSRADDTNDVVEVFVFVFVFVFEADPADGEEGGGVHVPPSSTSASLSVLLLVKRTLLPLPPPPPLSSLIFDTATVYTSVLLLALQQLWIKIPLKLMNLTLGIGKLGLQQHQLPLVIQCHNCI